MQVHHKHDPTCKAKRLDLRLIFEKSGHARVISLHGHTELDCQEGLNITGQRGEFALLVPRTF